MIVADANLLIHYVCGTECSGLARQVRDKDPDWISPAIWRAEVLNSLYVMQRSGLLDLPRALAAYSNASAATRSDNREEAPALVLATAKATGLTAYDALYVILAREKGIALVTEDRQILRACPDVAVSMKDFVHPPQQRETIKESRPRYRTSRRKKKG